MRVRAEFIRFLVLGGDEAAPVHERGVELSAAWIDGDLDLNGCEVKYPFSLKDCRSNNSLTLRYATTRAIDFGGSRIKSITATRARIGSSAYLNNGFRADGTVSFRGARIDGNLEFNAGEFEELDCVNATVTGDVFLSDRCYVRGSVTFTGARLNDVDCSKSTIEGGIGFDSAEINDVNLSEASVNDGVSFNGAKVNDVDARGSRLNDCASFLPR